MKRRFHLERRDKMSEQEIVLLVIWTIVYIIAGKIVVEDLYIGKKRVKGLLWIFWCPLLIALIILWLFEELINWVQIKINIKK
jgi:hypothetical protein